MTEVKKADLKSMDIPEDKLRQLKQAFPEAFTEGLKVDFDKLKLAIGENAEVGKERFGMNWPGKGDCFKIIQAPSVATLVPEKDASVNFETTENLFIEGDNLEVLKLLQKSYYGKIKMVYIDPPYNTGRDFIYPDDYAESLDTYLRYSKQVDDQGRKYSTNAEANGRFHSKWLNMIYPRLYLAKNLLKEDGVIFISIDDGEAGNLRKVCDEIFGEENFIAVVTRVAKTTSFRGNYFAPSKDYLLCYARNISCVPNFRDEIDELQFSKIETSGDRKGEKYRDDIAFYLTTLETRPNQRYFIECPDGSKVIPPGETFPPAPPKKGDGVWRWNDKTFAEKKNLIVFKRTKNSPLIDEKGNKAQWNLYTKSYLKERQEEGNLPRDFIDEFLNRNGSEELKALDIPFDFPKPSKLIKYLIRIVGLASGDIVFDFFAGSATTAHAVLECNQEEGVNLKFICVQLPEFTEADSEAYKMGYKTIADLGKERIRRVIHRIQDELAGQLNFKQENFDLGFKVFKLSQSNFKLWEGSVEPNKDAVEKQLEMHIEHINPKSSQDDILFELLLKAGFELTTKIEKVSMAGKMVYLIEGGLMLICLEKELTGEIIKVMAEKNPSRVICLDQGFAGNDQLKTNAVQIMKSKGVEDFRTV